jgi:hypothetical protein
MHSGPVQFVTVHAVPGHVTWHSGLFAQSTRQLDVPLHSTWQISPAAHPTVHGTPGLHCTSHSPAPATQSAVHGSFAAAAHTQSLPRHTSLVVEQPNANTITKHRLFMTTSDGRAPVYGRITARADIIEASRIRDRVDIFVPLAVDNGRFAARLAPGRDIGVVRGRHDRIFRRWDFRVPDR